MIFDISKLLDSISRVGPKTIFAVVIAAGTILFAPTSIMESLYLSFLRDNYGAWVGGIFVITCSLLLMSFCWWIGGKTSQSITNQRNKHRRRLKLNDLTPEEKGFLIPFLEDGETTRYAELSDGVVSGLVAKKIVYRPTNIGTEGITFAHNIHPWVKNELQKSPELLEGARQYPAASTYRPW